jgi:AcrR family transcriptional regulator
MYHYGMSVPYVEGGRSQQKARTRGALIEATRRLLSEGVIPTMENAASAASVSRTTAYRYFGGIHDLLVAAYPHAERRSLLPADAGEDAETRLRIVAEDQTRRVLEYEPEMRAVLRLSLDPATERPTLPMHRGQRIGWVEDALAPLRGELDDQELRGLTLGIGALLGIEAFVWLTDIAGSTRVQAAETMQDNALRLLRAALADRDAQGAAETPGPQAS